MALFRSLFLLAILAVLAPCQIFAGFYVSDCELEKDPKKALPLVSGCLQAVGEVAGLSRPALGESVVHAEGEIYTGIALSSLVGLHLRATLGEYRDTALEEARAYQRTVNSYVSFGNGTLDRWQLLLGQFYLPFGLDFSKVMPIYRESYKRQFFWRTPKPAISFSYSDLVGTRLELSLADESLFGLDKIGEKDRAFSGRFSSDLSALGGTKLIFSYYKGPENLRKLGFATLNYSARGGVTSFEWVRYEDSPHRGRYPFHQLIRFTHVTGFRNDARYVFEYEDDVELYFLTQLGYDAALMDKLMLRVSGGYYRSRFQKELNHFVWALGVRSRL